ncbi:acetolactate synthase 2 catalytic subunit [Chitinivorax sp. B]|uniref:acetolactate synthase 2 catalytic subunit n=1 Tax=Chitinivorax sp. B TaxID=2502235 RepID=UPI0010F4B9E6|nr:acetolactate synthase 2 catalytic subunit [Chitinivorax sp. B]
MRGADLMVEALRQEGVKEIFGYPGGAIMPFYDALYGAPVRHVLCRHEQGAALAACGYARASGRVGVCVATSGPGATNIVTALADAMLDSVPLVALTGQVARPLIGTDAFQEVDVLGMTMAVVKHSFLVESPGELAQVLADAFWLARSGRPGPVLVDIPKDIQLGRVPTGYQPRSSCRASCPNATALIQAGQLIRDAHRPLLYVGGGVVLADAVTALRAFADITGMPVVTTLKGIGVLPHDHPLNLGMLGMHGTQAANRAVQACDLLIAVGARFDDRATGKLDEFAPHAKVIHLDIDLAEIGKLRGVDVAITDDLNTVLPPLASSLAIEAWRETCLADKQRYAFRYDAPGPALFAPAFLWGMAELMPCDAIVCCDVGQHQMWVAQHVGFSMPRQHLTSGGLGTMGFGLPAAIGAQLAYSDRTVINVSGDGSFMMNVQELATVGRYQLPIKIVLLDNAMLGMVKQWQELFFEERYSETDLSDNPDFTQVAAAFGIPSRAIQYRDEQRGALLELLTTPGPMLLHVKIDRKTNVWPLVPPGKSNLYMLEGELECEAV